MDGHHGSDSFPGHLVGSKKEGEGLFPAGGLSGTWLLRIELADAAERKPLSPVSYCAVDLFSKSLLKWTVPRLGSQHAFLLE